MKTSYIQKRLSATKMATIEQANVIIEEYDAQNLRLTLRQLYYQFVSRDLLQNSDKNYKRLGSIISDGRLCGHIDWYAIEDRGRVARVPHHDTSVEDSIDMMKRIAENYTLDKWEGQSTYVELCVEKDALSGVLEPIAERFDVPLVVNKGYSSSSAMYEMATRYIEAMSGGRDGLCLYLGDHDPSGEDMVRDIRDRLHLFEADVKVEKISLTTAQVRQYHPPPNPAKMSDSRAAAYVAAHGRQSWELDALNPAVLTQLVTKAISAVIDKSALKLIEAREAAERQVMIDALENVEAP